MKVTAIGKFLRKLRIDNGEIMKDMADKFGITPAYLSAIELGKRPVPKDFLNTVTNEYQFTEFEKKALEKSIIQSADEVYISLNDKTFEERELAIGFARTFTGLDEEKIKKIKKLLGVLDDEVQETNGHAS